MQYCGLGLSSSEETPMSQEEIKQIVNEVITEIKANKNSYK